MIHTRTCVYQGVRSDRFSENLAYVLSERSLTTKRHNSLSQNEQKLPFNEDFKSYPNWKTDKLTIILKVFYQLCLHLFRNFRH